jgi:hypothetical protein
VVFLGLWVAGWRPDFCMQEFAAKGADYLAARLPGEMA